MIGGGWGSALIVFAGIVLLCVEMFVLPGFGIAGILGLLALGAGLALAWMGPVPGAGEAALALYAVISALAVLGVGAWAVFASRRGRYRALFGTSLDREDGYLSSLPRPELEGALGVAVTDLRPSGTAEVAGERLDVVTSGEWISAGTRVRLVHADGYRHVVEPAAELLGGSELGE